MSSFFLSVPHPNHNLNQGCQWQLEAMRASGDISRCRILFIFLYFCVSISCIHSYVIIGNDDPLDTAALHELFGATNGANWVNSTNWARPVSICSWFGVQSCSCNQTCRVTAFELRFNNLTGTLPAAMGLLDQLARLDLYSNQIAGSLPEAAFANLTLLSYLDLSFNLFSGTIPASIVQLTSLDYLDFTANRLIGTIPPALGSMSSITYMIALGNNQLNGTLPAELAQLNVSLFYVNDNELSGTISPLFDRWGPTIQFFFISANRFSGPIPTFGCNSKVFNIVMDHNSFNGSFPSCFNGSNFPALAIISASHNDLISTIPQSLMTMSALQYLDLSQNHLVGTLPSSVAGLKSLLYFDISSNQFSGSLPSTLSTLSTLRSLNVAHNSFTGTFSLLSSVFRPPVVNISANNFGGELMGYPGFASNEFTFKNTISSAAATLRIFDTRNNQLICPYPSYPSDTLLLRSTCMSTVDSYLSVLIPLAYLAGLVAFVGIVFVTFNRRKGCFRVSVRNIRKVSFCISWVVSVLMLGTDLLSISKMIYTVSIPVNNCDPFNQFAVFIDSMPQYGGLFYQDLLNSATSNFLDAHPGGTVVNNTFASSFSLIDSFSGYALPFRTNAEHAFQSSCQSFDGCDYIKSSRTCALLYSEKAQFGNRATRIFMACAYLVVSIRVVVELIAFSLVIHAGWNNSLYNPRLTTDFVMTNIYSVVLYLMLPNEKSENEANKSDVMANVVTSTDTQSASTTLSKFVGSKYAVFLKATSESTAEDLGIDTLKHIDKLKMTGLKAGLTTRQAFMDILASDPSHESYLWRLLYQGCLKSIPLLLLNFFYATDIAVLGLSPLNALSFLGGIVSVPVMLIQAYLAYLNPPVKLRSYKRYPFHKTIDTVSSVAQAMEPHDSDEESNHDQPDINIEMERNIGNSASNSESVPMPSMSEHVSSIEMVDMSAKSESQPPILVPVSAPRAPPSVKPGHSEFRWKSKAPPPPPPSKFASTMINSSNSNVDARSSERAIMGTGELSARINGDTFVAPDGSNVPDTLASGDEPKNASPAEHSRFHPIPKPVLPAKRAILLSKWSHKSPPPPPPKPDRV